MRNEEKRERRKEGKKGKMKGKKEKGSKWFLKSRRTWHDNTQIWL